MDKQATLGFILMGLVFMVWLWFSTPPPQQNQNPNNPSQSKQDSLGKNNQQPKQEQKPTPAFTVDTSGSAGMFTYAGNKEVYFSVETENSIYELSGKGGKPYRLYLKNYNNWYTYRHPEYSTFQQKSIQILNEDKGSSVDIEFLTTDGKKINTGNLAFTVKVSKYPYVIKGNDSLVVEFTSQVGKTGSIVKRYTFYGDRYDTRFDIELNGLTPVISNNAIDVVLGAGIRFVEENSVDEAQYSNSSYYTAGEQVIIDAPHDGTSIQDDFNGKVNWITVRNKYFATLLMPHNQSQVNGAFVKGYAVRYGEGIKEYYISRLKVQYNNQNSFTFSSLLYNGPVDYKILEKYNLGLEKIVDFGSFFGLKFIVRPIAEYVMLPIFRFLNSFIPNFGIVIILFSILLKILLTPLTKQSTLSMKKMSLLQPKMAEIKEKYKDDNAKQQKEIMNLYSTYGINPFGGCLPILLQMPVFIALFGLFQTAVELRQAGFMLWITDLSRPEVLFHLPFKLPLFGIDIIGSMALLMGITTFVQQKQSLTDPSQKAMIYIMPPMLTLVFMSFPAGLNLYYTMFNLLSILQQWYINKYSDIKLEPVKNKKKPGFMARLAEAAEQSAKSQQKKK